METQQQYDLHENVRRNGFVDLNSFSITLFTSTSLISFQCTKSFHYYKSSISGVQCEDTILELSAGELAVTDLCNGNGTIRTTDTYTTEYGRCFTVKFDNAPRIREVG